MADEQQPARALTGEIDPHKTRLSTPLVVVISAAIAIAGATWMAAAQWQGVQTRLQSLQESATKNVTKADLEDMKRVVKHEMRIEMRTVIVSCPQFTIKGVTHMACELIFREPP